MSLYAEPRDIEDIKQCYFYHTMDLPGVGTAVGEWDLRDGLDSYLGGFSFGGKRALDVGCATGILSFYMESKGAEVVSFDLDKNSAMDLVPFAKWEDYEAVALSHKLFIDRLNNGYWLAHRLMESKARVVYGNVYSIPQSIGAVDVCVFGSTLLHFRDPFLALQNGLRITREAVIVTDLLHGWPEQGPLLRFLPDAGTVEPKDAWWDIQPEWVIRAVGVLGFEDAAVSHHSQKYKDGEADLFTVVAKRKHGRVA